MLALKRHPSLVLKIAEHSAHNDPYAPKFIRQGLVGGVNLVPSAQQEFCQSLIQPTKGDFFDQLHQVD